MIKEAAEVQHTGARTTHQWPLWYSVLLLAACETAWLYGARPGINWPLSTLAVAAGLVMCRTAAGRTCRLNVALPLFLACLLSVGAALSANPANEVIIALSVLFALGSAVVALHADLHPTDGPGSWVVAAPYAAVLAAGEACDRLAQTVDAVRDGRGVPVIRGVALAVPVTLLLALLLSNADPTFAAARDFVASAFRDLPLLPRGLFFLVVSASLIGIFGIALRAGPQSAPVPPSNAAHRQLFGDTERLITSSSVALLFALFLILQVSYLFGNPGGRTGSGISYADAVHRGFVELNVASTVCAILLFTLRRYAVSEQTGRRLQALEWIVTLETQVLLVSAFHRVNLYERAYGFTVLRLHVQVYAAAGCVALILLLIELRGRPHLDRLIRRVMMVAAVAFVALTWGNADAWIARANLNRYAHMGQIDVHYLTHGLGPDAVPELVATLPHLPSRLATQLAVCLRNRYPGLPEEARARWFDWSLRRSAAQRALARLRADASTATVDAGTAQKYCSAGK